MLIGVCGTICSGKHTTAEYLVQHHGFLRLHLPSRSNIASRTSQHDNEASRRFLPSIADERGTRGLTFPDVDSLLEFVTKRWQEHWVLTDIEDEPTLEILLRRPFFLLLGVDAPITLRFQRFNARSAKRGLSHISLEAFIDADDRLLYGPLLSSSTSPPSHQQAALATSSLARLHSRSHLQLLNSYTDIPSYFNFLDTLDLPSETRLRPPWDAYFMTLAHLASLRSNCMKRRVGCVLTLHFRILSTGYNGTPRGLTNCNQGGCPRCNAAPSGGSALSTCLCLHAEENALLEAGRERIREGAVLYCDTCPCLTCSVKIAQVGVKEVVYSQGYNMDEASRRVLKEAGVMLRQYSPPSGGLLGGTGSGEEGKQLVVRNGT